MVEALIEALIEIGIGETRALVTDGGRVVEAYVEREGDGLRAGDIWDARLTAILAPGRGIVRAGDHEALLEPLPPGLTEGALLRVEIAREALPEARRPRLAKARAVPGAGREPGKVRAGPDLVARLRERGLTLREVTRFGPDDLEAAGWSELLDQAATGHVPFDGGLLTISPTPAMTVIDVDGALPPVQLARAAAVAVAHAIRCFDLTGSIVIDFPGTDRAARAEIAALLDAHLPPPFERTAVNGFGLLQIVRPRRRASLIERIQGEPVPSAALALLRQAERGGGSGGTCTLTAGPAVAGWLAACAGLITELERRIGASVRLQADARLAISAGHVHA